ncbi:Serine/threonine protein phosphatase [Streptococcus sp. DD10]|uniref:metallophosphoesterase family protein n=1 Tax=Streptococcus sp. DD10 TaxID=1777878 RepID=UPI0007995611|nr:metallophosphoesterase family protein [Streptococcus sp. DD10]KXT73649.1 Serine/threonine protein phosphatase [Streptococcus sp. DD10]
MMQYFVVGDVHGKVTMLERLLKSWDSSSQLIFLGDLIDRGEDSLNTVRRVRQLAEKEGATCLKGNHEYMFLSWLDDPVENYEHYRRNGGDTTINSFLGRPLSHLVDGIEDAKKINESVPELVAFIRDMPFVFETDRYIFVHAGIDLSLEDWHNTSDYQKVWLRTPFHEGENKTGKMIVFGHTPVYGLLEQEIGTSEIWSTDDGKIGLDGGAVYGGVLHGTLFGIDGIIRDHFVVNDGFIAADE